MQGAERYWTINFNGTLRYLYNYKVSHSFGLKTLENTIKSRFASSK